MLLDDLRRLVLVAGEQPLVEADVAARATGSSEMSAATNSRPGTYLPRTTRQTVSGVARSRPSGPQSQVQNATATSSPTCETPAAPA